MHRRVVRWSESITSTGQKRAVESTAAVFSTGDVLAAAPLGPSDGTEVSRAIMRTFAVARLGNT
jgi:hypothetical protein